MTTINDDNETIEARLLEGAGEAADLLEGLRALGGEVPREVLDAAADQSVPALLGWAKARIAGAVAFAEAAAVEDGRAVDMVRELAGLVEDPALVAATNAWARAVMAIWFARMGFALGASPSRDAHATDFTGERSGRGGDGRGGDLSAAMAPEQAIHLAGLSAYSMREALIFGADDEHLARAAFNACFLASRWVELTQAPSWVEIRVWSRPMLARAGSSAAGQAVELHPAANGPDWKPEGDPAFVYRADYVADRWAGTRLAAAVLAWLDADAKGEQ